MSQEKLTKDEQLFLTLVTNFQTSAWIRLGKIKDPITDRMDVNLDECSYAIEMLKMLYRRVGANLTERERKHTDKVISDLMTDFNLELGRRSNPEPPAEKSDKALS